MAKQERFKIINGPSKFDLMCALFKKGTEIYFTIKNETKHDTVRVRIKGVSSQGEENDADWVLKGNYRENSVYETSDTGWINFEAYYESCSRTGNLKTIVYT